MANNRKKVAKDTFIKITYFHIKVCIIIRK